MIDMWHSSEFLRCSLYFSSIDFEPSHAIIKRMFENRLCHASPCYAKMQDTYMTFKFSSCFEIT
jgi:hypothetical protein